MFLENGYFTGLLANTMITALSNLLKIPIIIFSSIECHPIIVINPREVSCSLPVLVAFNQNGLGHYDGLVPKSQSAITASHTVKVGASNLEPVQKSTCGRSDKTERSHCLVTIIQVWKYTSMSMPSKEHALFKPVSLQKLKEKEREY